MRIARFIHQDAIRFGIVDDVELVVLEGDPMFAGFDTTGERVPLGDVALLAPVIPRSKVVCVGRNYRAHAEEFGNEVPAEPMLFLKPNTAVIGPGDVIVRPPQSQLHVVRGRARRRDRVDREERGAERVSEVIFGYTIANDITARDLQKTDGQWARAKGFDTFCPLGPAIETEFDVASATLETRLNGEVAQSAPLTDMIHSVADIIAYASAAFTLLPGDVILTGTPSGVGPFVAGDTIEVEIIGLGILRNSARDALAPTADAAAGSIPPEELGAAVQRRTVWVLSVGQVLGGLAFGATVSLGALLAAEISGDDSFSGLATAFITLGSAALAVPLAAFARRRGRRVSLTRRDAARTGGRRGRGPRRRGRRLLPAAAPGVRADRRGAGGQSAVPLRRHRSRLRCDPRPRPLDRRLGDDDRRRARPEPRRPRRERSVRRSGCRCSPGPYVFGIVGADGGRAALPDLHAARPAAARPAHREAAMPRTARTRSRAPTGRSSRGTRSSRSSASHGVMVSVMAMTPVHLLHHGAA